jgi:arylsulfatase A-like enzyme
MCRRYPILILVSLLAVTAVPAVAQQTLGDLVSQAGYEGVIGKWAATDNQGRQCTVEYKWALDKHVILVDAKIGELAYHGMIMYQPYDVQPTQVGADNMGGIWNGTWDQDYDGLVNRQERINPDGNKEKLEHVYTLLDTDTFKVKEYPVGSDGWRASSPRGELTFKRQKAK